MTEFDHRNTKILIRRATDKDSEAITRIHYDAVHVTAAKDYDQPILDQWSTVVTKERIENYRNRPDANKEITLVAEINGQIVGVGSFVPETKELNAVYVSPAIVRQGVGSALLKELEKTASPMGIEMLWLDSSLTAEKFYLAHGFIISSRGEHVLKSGLKMACVQMQKRLQKDSV
jgi:putative acetyltransferase